MMTSGGTMMKEDNGGDSMPKCTYCNKSVPIEKLKELPDDDSPQLERKYCEKCYPDVKSAYLNLPWNVAKRKEKWGL